MLLTKREQRIFPRVNSRLNVRCQVRGKPACSHGVTYDISASGIAFISDRFIAPRTELNLQLNVMNKMLKPAGRIAWASVVPYSGRYRLGVEFIEFDIIEKNYLVDYLQIQSSRV